MYFSKNITRNFVYVRGGIAWGPRALLNCHLSSFILRHCPWLRFNLLFSQTFRTTDCLASFLSSYLPLLCLLIHILLCLIDNSCSNNNYFLGKCEVFIFIIKIGLVDNKSRGFKGIQGTLKFSQTCNYSN